MTAAPRRSSLAAWLARWVGVSTALSLVVFAATVALILKLAEDYEYATEEVHAVQTEEEELAEAYMQVGLAMLVASPLAVLLAVVGAWWLARRALGRVALVSDTATRMTMEQLSARLPVSTAADELDALATALNGLFERLEVGVALQRQFAADASHELRSPLAVLSSALEIARRRSRSGEEWEDVTDRALRQARHMTQLVEALLQLTRAGASRRSEAVTVSDLVYDVADHYEALAFHAGVKLQVTISENSFVTIDPDLVAVALGNIVANAISHSPPDGVVQIEAVAQATAVVLRVVDQGPGVPLQERERIFHPFVRGDAGAADRSGARVGLGLGLAIARRVVEGHGAHIVVTDAPRGGASFSFQLPRAPAPTHGAAT